MLLHTQASAVELDREGATLSINEQINQACAIIFLAAVEGCTLFICV